MLLRKNRLVIYFLDFVTRIIFFVPLLFQKRSSEGLLPEPPSILVVELWGIGDLMMMSSILKPLRQRFPKAKISLLCKPVAAELFGDYRYFDELVPFEFPWTKFKGKYRFWKWDWKGLRTLVGKLNDEKFDLAIDARGDLRNNLLLFLSGAKQRIGYGCLGGGYFLTRQIPCATENIHRVDKWQGIAQSLGIRDRLAPLLELDQKEEEWTDTFLRENAIRSQGPLIAMHPGAGNPIRRWPCQRFKEVAVYLKKEYNANILFFSGPEDDWAPDTENDGFITVKLKLRHLAALLKKTDFLICNDSGPMHIAAAVSTPVIAIFGPGDVKSIGPYGDRHKIVFKPNLDCRPCFDHCKYPFAPCINDIKTDDIIGAAEIMLQKTKNARTNKDIP